MIFKEKIMGDISTHFNRKEFACKCGCGFNAVDKELLEVIEDVRTHFGKPLIINSANRCESHNAKEGGSKNSQHLKGMAADIRINGVTPDSVAAYLLNKYPNKYGIGMYNTFTHIDVRAIKSRWDYR